MSQALINTYESAAKLMEQMLIAARQNAWEKVTELEQSYMLKIEVVKTLEQNMRLASESLAPEYHAQWEKPAFRRRNATGRPKKSSRGSR